MKTLFILLIVLICGVGLAYLMHLDPGYILVAYHHYTIETTLWFGIVALLIILIIVKIVFGVLSGIITFPALFKLKQKKKHISKAQQLLREGLLDIISGDFTAAIQALSKGEKYENNAILYRLASAYALQKTQKPDESHAIIEQALQEYPEQEGVIKLLQAKLWLNNQCYKKVLALLQSINDKHAKTVVYYQMLVQCYCALQQWHEAQDAFNVLKRCKYINEHELSALAQTIIIGELTSCPIDELEKYWSSLDKKDRHNEAYLWLVTDRFIENNMFKKAFELLKQAIKQHSTEELWELMGLCIAGEARAVLHFSEKTLKQVKDQWYVYNCAGVAAYECGDIQLSQHYLIQANDLQVSDNALLLLADIYHQQGDAENLHKACLALLELNKGSV